MKVAVIILVMLGIVAAGAATVLVQSLPILKEKKVDTVGVLVAETDLAARTRLTETEVRVENVPKTGLPVGYFMSPAQAIGKVLKVAVEKGEILTANSCIAKGSIDDLLRPGMLAFPAPVTRRSATLDLLYPGCVVDVFATFPLRNREKGEAVVTPLLQNIQVLAVADDTVISQSESEASGSSPVRRPGSGNVTVTLEVTARQAAALQLVLERGTIGLAMRNPTDKGWNPMGPMVVKEGQLTAGSEALDPQMLAWVNTIQRVLNPEMAPDPNAPGFTQPTSTGAVPDPNAMLSLPAPSVPMPGVQAKKSTMAVTIIRGQKVEETEVERGDQADSEKDEETIDIPEEGS